MDWYSYHGGDEYVGILGEEAKYKFPYICKSVLYLMQISF
uniref:Uncharacterized protein n=1 Tax=Arundo donax TaxID=35708 RepID=A0A0A9C8E5_ARUDO